jgi:hypothetical protein
VLDGARRVGVPPRRAEQRRGYHHHRHRQRHRDNNGDALLASARVSFAVHRMLSSVEKQLSILSALRFLRSGKQGEKNGF